MEYIPGSTLRSTMSADGFYSDEDLSRKLPILDWPVLAVGHYS
jgi:hypothetical protein